MWGKDWKYAEGNEKYIFRHLALFYASQFELHRKRKPGDGYHPEVFIDQPGYDAAITICRSISEKGWNQK